MSTWQAVDRLLDQAPGDYSVVVQAPGGDIVYRYAPDVVRRAASLIKVPLAMALVHFDSLRQEGFDGVDLDVVETLREEDRAQGDGAWQGTIDRAPAGTRWTRWELIEYALRESDNTAANLLIRALGMDAVNRFLAASPLQLQATRMGRRFMDVAAAEAGHENWTTAREMCILFQALCRPVGRYAPLVEWLMQSTDRDKIVAGLPEGTPVAHKVGDLPGVEHDAGIVYAATGPYIVALLSECLPDVETGKRTLREVSRLVYGRMVPSGIRST